MGVRRATPVTRAELARWAEEHATELVFFEPPEHFDHAIVGLVHGFGQEPAVVYDEGLVLAAMAADGMTAEDAEEWFSFNTIGAYVGEATPRFLIRLDDDVDAAEGEGEIDADETT